ncbi:RNase adapter RapZ [Psychromonas sp. MB-3u-54]|uniref:RNase adapter RapZ n=1 Tax=Psychromonas sp. MB-3u-54 TaxID=2058319 RepID=UPI000C33A4B1|nr:RNase adapter RapZ [Psychromonas sp. MB-3u-54]PKH01888.1 RNase adapter RapZ [Psychromonas sp. MB-3u-54]
MKLIVISGRSGSGKTIALHVLEDLGYNCIDGVPFQLLEQLIDTVDPKNNKVAISLDIRNLPTDASQIQTLLSSLQQKVEVEIVYLDAISSELIRRYSETRRLHPLSKNKLSLSQALELENELLEPIHKRAALSIDTTTLSIHNLNERLKIHLQGSTKSNLLIIFQSFGFKNIHPDDADYIFDVRFLPNPHWEPALQKYTGKDQPVKAFLNDHLVVKQTINQIENLFHSWLPYLEENNRNYVTIAIGCTGGKHRSVYVAEQLAAQFKQKYQVQIEHKGLKKLL